MADTVWDRDEPVSNAGVRPVTGGARSFVPFTTPLLVCIAYYVAARIGIALTLRPQPVSTLWPPNAVLLSLLLLTPTRTWWTILLAALPAHLAVELRAGIPLPMVLCWFVSNSSEALIGAGLLRRLGRGPARFDSFRGVGIFVLAGVLGVFLSSFLDAAFVELNAWGVGDYWYTWRARFFSNVLATLTLVPVIVTLGTSGLAALRGIRGPRLLEAGLLAASLLAVCLFAFTTERPTAPSTTPALLYAPLPFLLWAAVRFGPAATSGCVLVVALVAVAGAIGGHGPFAASTPADNALSMQLFLIVISIPLMALAAVTRERLRAQEEARQSEKRLQLALDAAQMGTWEWDITSDRTAWSDKTREIFGLDGTRPDPPLAGFFELVAPADRRAVAAAVQRAVDDGTPYETEFRVAHPDGTMRWVLARAFALFDRTGRPVRLIGVSTDVSERKHADQALRASEERLSKTFRASPDAIMILRRSDGRILEVNDTWEAVCGHTRADAIGRTPAELEMYPNAEERERAEQLLAAGGRVREHALELYTRARETRQAVLAADTVEMGGEPCLIVFIRDVTEQRRAEVEAHQKQLEVAHLSRVAVLGEFSGALAHELKQPLTAILANARAAQRLLRLDAPDVEELRDILEDIAADGRRSGEVIDRLRAFFRKGDLQPRPVDLNEVVTEVLGLVHGDLDRRRVSVDVRLAPVPAPVFADRVQLQQVLLNLLLNACEAMDGTTRGERRVTIRTMPPADGVVGLSVADRGPGIPEEVMRRLFEPFVTSKPHGLGLGLPICRSIVTAHGGRLWATNDEGGGATFHLVLPAEPAAPPPAAEPS